MYVEYFHTTSASDDYTDWKKYQNKSCFKPVLAPVKF